MPRTLSVNAGRDIFTLNGNISISQDKTAVLEICQQVMQTRLGEMTYHVTTGINYDESIWNIVNIPIFEANARQELQNVEGVEGVKNFETVVENNVLKYSVEIETIYGSGIIGL